MIGFTRLRPTGSRGIVPAAIVAFAFGVAAFDPAPAVAQGFGFFGGLFGQPQQAQPAYPGYGTRKPVPRRRVRRAPVEPREQAQKEPAKEQTPVKNATIFVDVLGDSLGQLLANGLDEALSDRQDVGIVHRGRGSSGLVAEDYFNWQKTVNEMLAGKDKIDVAVMMIGSNDRQVIRQDGKSYEVGTEEWKAIYAKRVLAIDEAFRRKNIPLIWVGLPITKNSDFADDMAAFNDIYREAAAKTGATYIDTWEAFSDDDGDFDAFGPDVNGQTVRLRTTDGIYFTKAGARKLAHFVEAPIRRDLDGKTQTPVVSTEPDAKGIASTGKPAPDKPTSDKTDAGKSDTGKSDTGKTSAKPAVIPKPDAGPVANLNEAPTASNGELSTAARARGMAKADALVESALAKGGAQPGRADDLRWSASAKPEP